MDKFESSSDCHRYKLFCPKCSKRLEPLIIDTTVNEDAKQETIWWTCQGLRDKSCEFPLCMPADVFWTTRNAQQIENDVMPLPNFHLLPPMYHHMYAAFFTPIQSNQSKTVSAPLADSSFKKKADPGRFPQRPSKFISVQSPVLVSRLSKKQETPKMSLDQCVELIDFHVPYTVDTGTISARLGKEYQPSSRSSENNSFEWSELGLGLNDHPSRNRKRALAKENLPSCSSETSSVTEQDRHEFPEPLRFQSFGDPELDKLCSQNLSAILGSKELKKRRRRPKHKPVETIPTPQHQDPQPVFDYPSEFESMFMHYPTDTAEGDFQNDLQNDLQGDVDQWMF